MTNKALLSIIGILLVGILSIGVIHALDDNDPVSSFENIGESLDEAGEEIADEIDDHTDAR